MDTLDTLLFKAARPAGSGRLARPCPGAEVLADHAAGRLPVARARELDAHLAACGLCSELVTLGREGELEALEPMPVPERVLERARSLVPEKTPVWQVVLRILSEGLELLKHTGVLVPAQPLAVRGEAVEADAQSPVAEHYTFQRDLPPYLVRLSVQRQGDARVTLTLSLEGQQGPARSFQVELWQEERLRGVRNGVAGTATFSAIQPGDYRLVIGDKGSSMGEVYVTLLE